MSRILVTGGAGFIGSHLVRALLARGDTVCIIDNFVTGTAANLSSAVDLPQAEVEIILRQAMRRQVSLTDRCRIVVGDICDPAVMADACRGVEVVFHQAAQRSVPRSVSDPVAAHEANATGTLRVLEAARSSGVKRLVNASSSSVYGDTLLPKHEGQVPQPKSPYAASKLAGEAYCAVYTRAFGLPTISLRYFNVFGPLQDPQSEYAAVIPKFIRLALEGKPLPVEGDGGQTRDFTYVADVVEANLLAAGTDTDAVVLNIGSGVRHSVLDLATRIGRVLGRRPELAHMPGRPGDVRDSEADIELARRSIGYEPRLPFDAGLARTIHAMQGEGI